MMNQQELNDLRDYLASRWEVPNGFDLVREKAFINLCRTGKYNSKDTYAGNFYQDGDSGRFEFDPADRSIFAANSTNLFMLYFVLSAFDLHAAGDKKGYENLNIPI